MKRILRKLLLVLALPATLAGCSTARLDSGAIAASTSPAPQAAAQTMGGVAAGNDPRIGPIGEAIMAKGGSATDAAIAMMLALAVVEPQSSGIGGGGFLVRGAPDGTVEAFDGRETAPAAADQTWFLGPDSQPRDRGEATLSGLSIGVPGAIALAAEAHARHGSLAWADLFAPAIALARDGFRLTPRLSGSLASYPARAGRSAQGKSMFYASDGSAPAAGEVLRLPELANTLEMIASGGPDAFYQGEFARSMAAAIAADTPVENVMTAEDLAGYAAMVRDPACIIYRLHRICTMGPPSSGGIAMLMTLAQLERFDLASMGLRNPVTWHVFLESQRLAYADREFFVGDPAFVDVPVTGLLDPAYIASRSALIDPAASLAQVAHGLPQGAPLALGEGQHWPENGTTHFVAVGPDGTMVSYTATVEGAFGSGLTFGGFYLNNELTDFSFAPEQGGKVVANAVEGGKRPVSSMSPAVVYDPQGQPLLTLGAAGGALIPVQTARAIVAVIDFGLPLEEALGLPFAMAVGGNGVLVEEGTWMEQLGPQLEALGHGRIIPFGQLLRTTGAMRTDAGWQALYDPRLADLVRIPPTAGTEASVEAGFSEGLSAGDDPTN